MMLYHVEKVKEKHCRAVQKAMKNSRLLTGALALALALSTVACGGNAQGGTETDTNATQTDAVSIADTTEAVTEGEDTVTSCEGVFAAGDCRTKDVRQLATAAADGAVAALKACAYADAN